MRLSAAWTLLTVRPHGFALEMTGPPRFLKDPNARMPRPSTPVRSRVTKRRVDAAFRAYHGVGPHDWKDFGAQSRSLRAPCVRFAAGVAPAPRNTRFRLGRPFAGQGCPAGSQSEGFSSSLIASSFTRLLLAHGSRNQESGLDFLTSANLSPDGEKLALTARGQVFVAPLSQGLLSQSIRQAQEKLARAATGDGAAQSAEAWFAAYLSPKP